MQHGCCINVSFCKQGMAGVAVNYGVTHKKLSCRMCLKSQLQPWTKSIENIEFCLVWVFANNMFNYAVFLFAYYVGHTYFCDGATFPDNKGLFGLILEKIAQAKHGSQIVFMEAITCYCQIVFMFMILTNRVVCLLSAEVHCPYYLMLGWCQRRIVLLPFPPPIVLVLFCIQNLSDRLIPNNSLL